MRIAVCSLSQFSYVAEFCDAAQRLTREHDVCYFLGFNCRDSIDLLRSRQLPYKILLDPTLEITSVIHNPAAAKTTFELFSSYFIRYAELVLPSLIRALEAWNPDTVVVFYRDYAGMTAAEALGIPWVTFMNDSPQRVQGVDPPFYGGVSRDAPVRLLRFGWKLYDKFESELCKFYNRTIRFPYGLCEIDRVSTLHSTKLTIITSIPELMNKFSAEPDYIQFVGPLYSGWNGRCLSEIDAVLDSPVPRIFVSLGNTYQGPLLDKCLAALTRFSGTLIVSSKSDTGQYIDSKLGQTKIISRPFFNDIHGVTALADTVVTVCGSKTVLTSLQHGKPMICVPTQGEQREKAYQLKALGVAEFPCRNRWDDNDFVSATNRVTTDPCYRHAAKQMQRIILQAGGLDQVAQLFRV